jgi:periplasmic divalent cation tolerance protein
MSVVSVTAVFANLLPEVQSIYHWQGDIEEGREVIALFKTTAAQADRLIARIAALHSYDIPCVLSAPVDKVLADYADWVEQNVRV